MTHGRWKKQWQTLDALCVPRHLQKVEICPSESSCSVPYPLKKISPFIKSPNGISSSDKAMPLWTTPEASPLYGHKDFEFHVPTQKVR
ncbi:hypothetical protein TNCV_927311 [Trichonephila clavipes]|nr:hypothetical protein TNCV_927311 [Trichonephila clavipes]